MWSRAGLATTTVLIVVSTNLAIVIGLFWSQNNRMGQNVSGLKDEVQLLSVKVRRAESRYRLLTKTADRLNDSVKELAGRLDSVNQQIESANQDDRQKLADLKKQLDELGNSYNDHVTKYSQTIDNINQALRTYNNYVGQIRETQRRLDELAGKVR